ncbi:MAG: photosystem I reaction center subunit XI [Cyanobacteria bacterium J06633_2]
MSEAITPAGDPQIGNLATPLNSSPFSLALIRNLPAYRQGLSANRRGLEIGMAHGYFIYGPLALLGPLRDSDYAGVAGVVGAVALVTILTIALSLHGSVREGDAIATVTTPNPPVAYGTKEGWSEFASGFFLGGCGGAIFAFILCEVLPLRALAEIIM